MFFKVKIFSTKCIRIPAAQDTWLGGRRKPCFILKFSLPYRYLLRFTEVLVVLLFKKKKNTFALSNALKSEEYMYSCSTAAKGFVLRALINNAYVHVHVLSSTTCTCSNAALVNLVYYRIPFEQNWKGVPAFYIILRRMFLNTKTNNNKDYLNLIPARCGLWKS